MKTQCKDELSQAMDMLPSPPSYRYTSDVFLAPWTHSERKTPMSDSWKSTSWDQIEAVFVEGSRC